MDQAIWGADPEGLEQFASDLSQASGQFRQIQRQLSARVHAAPWSGSDAIQFLDSWRGPYSSSLLSTASALEQAALIVRRNAAEQRAAGAAETGSTKVGNGLASGVPGGGGGGGGWGDESGWHGLSGSAEASGSRSIGPLDVTGGANVETFKGTTDSGVYFTPLQYDAVTGRWSALEVGATALAGYNLVAASANGGAKLGAATLAAERSISIGPQVNARSDLSLDKDGVSAHVAAGASIARLEGSNSASAFGQKATVQGHVTLGPNAHASLDGKVSGEKLKLSASLGYGLLFGIGLNVNLELDPGAVAKNLNEKFANLW